MFSHIIYTRHNEKIRKHTQYKNKKKKCRKTKYFNIKIIIKKYMKYNINQTK